MGHLQALAAKEHLSKLADRKWGLKASEVQGQLFALPVYGAIPAGLPAMQEQAVEETLRVDPAVFGLRRPKRHQYWALRVAGDSMIDAHILDGDLVVLERREPRTGDIVAALVDDTTTTLKRLVRIGGRPVLRAGEQALQGHRARPPRIAGRRRRRDPPPTDAGLSGSTKLRFLSGRRSRRASPTRSPPAPTPQDAPENFAARPRRKSGIFPKLVSGLFRPVAAIIPTHGRISSFYLFAGNFSAAHQTTCTNPLGNLPGTPEIAARCRKLVTEQPRYRPVSVGRARRVLRKPSLHAQ